MLTRLVKIGLVLVVASTAGCTSNNATTRARERLAHFQSFPFHFRLPDLDGKIVSLGDYKGKVVIVDLWGTWCPPCREEIPHFVDLYRKYHASGLEIVGINYEMVAGDEAREKVRKYVKENDIPYPCLLGDQETEAIIPGFKGYPTTLFIDRSGKVRLKLAEYTPKGELEGIVSALLDEPGQTASR